LRSGLEIRLRLMGLQAPEEGRVKKRLLGLHVGVWDYASFAAMSIIGVVGLSAAVFILGLPGRIAIARNHPNADAINVIQSVRSRPAKVGDKLVTRDFGTGTRGFASADDPGLAVCVMLETELAFAGEVTCLPTGLFWWRTTTIDHQAIFRQVNKKALSAHHDALEFPDGRTVLLTFLREGQAATVLQLPAQPVIAVKADAQMRVAYVG
jgi:hypothetical protein